MQTVTYTAWLHGSASIHLIHSALPCSSSPECFVRTTGRTYVRLGLFLLFQWFVFILLTQSCHGTALPEVTNFRGTNYCNTPSGSYGHPVHSRDKSHVKREAGFKPDWESGRIDFHRVASWNITGNKIWYLILQLSLCGDRKPVGLTNVCPANARGWVSVANGGMDVITYWSAPVWVRFGLFKASLWIDKSKPIGRHNLP